jgi:hypothetical protein
MATKKSKSFDSELDDLLAGIELPSEEELTEETRKEKISKTTAGRKKSDNTRAKISESQKGKKVSDETRARASDSLKGRKLSAEHRAKVSVANIGRKVSKETRAKIGARNKGKKHPPKSEETRAKLSASLKGHPGYMAGKTHSEETRAKISESQKGKRNSEETRAKISEAKKGKSYGGNFKPVSTPYGVFSSLTKAGEYEETITGKKFNPNRFTGLLKNPESGYKRISIEEYIMLTGKEL